MNSRYQGDQAGAFAAAGYHSALGRTLREAREQAGMSIDDVAAQLKLSPRQIRALEDEAYELLPSKAFVRGFIRNYARLLHLDGNALVSMLDAPSVSPMFGPIAPSRGELPQLRKASSVRTWILPILLLAVIAVGIYYEWQKAPATPTATAPADSKLSLSIPPDAAVTLPAADPMPPTAASESSPLNPSDLSSKMEHSQKAGGAINMPAATPPPRAAKEKKESAPPRPAGKVGRIDLKFGQRSWIQVRDQSGELLLSQISPAGSRYTLSGKVPLSVVIGNAKGAKLVYNGKAIDLKPHQHQNVARLTLN